METQLIPSVTLNDGTTSRSYVMAARSRSLGYPAGSDG